MPNTPIDPLDEKFASLLRRNINRIVTETHQGNLNLFYEKKGISNAFTTIRVSIDTKNKIKKMLRPHETQEELIQRLMETVETNERLKTEVIYLQKLEKENQQLIKYIETVNKRERKTLMLHPDFKIEYSYNESKLKSYEDFAYNLEIVNFVLRGKPISEREGIKTVQTIHILKSLKEINLNSDVRKLIQQKELLLENEGEFIKTKYLIYFKTLYFIINKKLDKKLREDYLMNLEYWKEIYESKSLPKSSLEEDVHHKLKMYELEINQLKNDKERRWTNLKE